MHEVVNHHDLLLLFRLIAAHMLANALFQTKAWGKLREKVWKVEQSPEGGLSSRELVLRSLTAGVIIYVFAFSWSSFWLPFVIIVSRLILDRYKYRKETGLFFVTVLFGYVIIIIMSWLVLVTDNNFVKILKIICSILSNAKLWMVTLVYALMIWPSGIWVEKITAPWREELDNTKYEGLAKAGMWIGRLERVLILTFILIGHYEAIGFLIAAKSIFRFGEIKNGKDRKQAEYMLIGTMISFVIVIFFGFFTTWVLQQLPPA